MAAFFSQDSIRTVEVLPQEVARKIAAGEVIDRPSAIVRELLDNALDAGASRITVELEGGGIDKIRVVDDGYGMTKADLEKCALPHTTSKIRTESDLLELHTLGFRGEALSSIAAVSRLEVTSIRVASSDNTDSHAWKMESSISISGIHYEVQAAHLAEGTVVQAAALFENFPARRQFLKRPASEAASCKQTFIEKALPHAACEFRLRFDGKEVLHLARSHSSVERVVTALGCNESLQLFTEVPINGENFSGSLVLAHQDISRKDRKDILIFVNGRRIWEYSLVQAIEYGAIGYFPNGTHPIACLFLNINPALVDFNIHPAKKEARFKDIASIHRAVSQCVRSFYARQTVRAYATDLVSDIDAPSYMSYTQKDLPLASRSEQFASSPLKTPAQHFFQTSSGGTHKNIHSFSVSHIRDTYARVPPLVQSEKRVETVNAEKTRYVGQVLGVFLLVEKGERVFLIDQHAAHERILFEEMMNASPEVQELLIPYIIETECEEEDAYIAREKEVLERAGFTITHEKTAVWTITTVPHKWTGTARELQEDILYTMTSGDEVLYNLCARAACRSAVMDGDMLDDSQAVTLAEKAFALADPHCPHGRPIWLELTKDQLFKAVKRT